MYQIYEKIVTTIAWVLCTIRDFMCSIWSILRKWYRADKSNELVDTALMFAAWQGDSESVRVCIATGADVNASCYIEPSDFLTANRERHTETMRTLIAVGADVHKSNKRGYTALMHAAAKGDSEIVETLITAGADVNKVTEYGYTGLIYASYRGHIEIVETLIAAKADVNKTDNDGHTALMRAAQGGHNEIVETLIKAKADVDKVSKFGDTGLIYASYRGHTETVKALIVAGAYVNKADTNGDTALWYAATRGYSEIVKVLIAAGADVNRANQNGYTALIEAARSGHSEVVKALIAARVDVDKVSKFGKTALIEAAARGHTKIVKLFLEFGVNVNKTSNNGKTVLMEAIYRGHMGMIAAIENFKAAYPTIIAIQDNKMSTLVITEEDAQKKTEAGYTALMAAFASDDIALVEKLLAYGGDIYAQDACGRTALSCARSTTMINYFIRSNSLVSTPWSYEQRLTMTVRDVKAWMRDYKDMLPKVINNASIIDQDYEDPMEKIRVCEDDTMKATEFFETDDHLLYTVYCAKVVREMKEREMSSDTKTLVSLIESKMYLGHGYPKQALDRLLDTPEIIDVYTASYRIELDEMLLMTHENLHHESLWKLLKLFMHDHITTAPEKSEDYQALLALTDEITTGKSGDLDKSIKELIAKAQAFGEDKEGVEGVFGECLVKWAENSKIVKKSTQESATEEVAENIGVLVATNNLNTSLFATKKIDDPSIGSSEMLNHVMSSITIYRSSF